LNILPNATKGVLHAVAGKNSCSKRARVSRRQNRVYMYLVQGKNSQPVELSGIIKLLAGNEGNKMFIW
jgi:hypothetical protein